MLRSIYTIIGEGVMNLLIILQNQHRNKQAFVSNSSKRSAIGLWEVAAAAFLKFRLFSYHLPKDASSDCKTKIVIYLM